MPAGAGPLELLWPAPRELRDGGRGVYFGVIMLRTDAVRSSG